MVGINWTGTNDADRKVGTNEADVLDGRAGDDYLEDGMGSDKVYGGAGDDTINNIGGSDLFDGGDGNDTLITDISSGFDERSFEVGFDTVAGTHGRLNSTVGQDTIAGIENFILKGNFNAVVTGGDEDNIFTTDAGDDVITGGGGNNTLNGGAGDDTLKGGAGDDTLSAWIGNDKVYAGAGNDTIINTGGEDLFDGGEDIDTLVTDLSQAVKDKLGFSNWDFDIVLDLTADDPHMRHYGLKPDGTDYAWDEIYGIENYTLIGNFNAILTGGDDDNTFITDAGDDILNGGDGNDILVGGAGDDTLYGGAGDDTYVFEFQGNDTVIDSSGSDIVVADTKGDNGELRFRQLYQSNDQLVLEGSRENTDSKISMSGVESIKWGVIDDGYTMTLGVSGETSNVTNRMYVGTLESDTLVTGKGDYVEGYGADGDDTITVLGDSSWVSGDGGNDTLIGGEGNDTLKGDYTSEDAGNDILFGNGGNDTLSGNAGDDTLTGGSGSDTFQFHGFFEHDTITDYDSDEDILEFYASDGSALNISDLIETMNTDGNRVLSTADGLSSVTLEGTAGITPVSGGLAMSIVSKDGDVVTFGVFANSSSDPGEDGIGSFDFTISHDVSDMQIVASSFDFAMGLSGVPNYDADTGTLTAGAFTINNVDDLDAPLLTFEATVLDTNAPISIQIADIVVDGVDLANTTEVFDFSALAITTTIIDRFGNAMSSAEAHAYEDSVNEITATLTTDNVTVFDTASGSDVLIDAVMDIDTASDNAIGAFDALQALRLAVGLDKSDGTSEWHDYIAADINKDGRVSADDALNILKFAVGLTDGPSADWVFVDGDADYSGIDSKNTDYNEGVLISDVMTDMYINMTGILVGDVDGSYIA
jgi:Ca2+-binding RTX toxin-like protein